MNEYHSHLTKPSHAKVNEVNKSFLFPLLSLYRSREKLSKNPYSKTEAKSYGKMNESFLFPLASSTEQGRSYVVARGGHSHHWSENGPPAGPPNLTIIIFLNPPEQKHFKAETNEFIFFYTL